jgi:hypothetical protein
MFCVNVAQVVRNCLRIWRDVTGMVGFGVFVDRGIDVLNNVEEKLSDSSLPLTYLLTYWPSYLLH